MLSSYAGNWNEDQYGCDVLLSPLNSSSAAAAASSTPSRLYNPESTTHISYGTGGHDLIHRGVYDEKMKPRLSPEVDKHLLFAHKGSSPIDRRYQTSYLASYSCGNTSTQPSVDHTVKKIAAQENGSEEGLREQSRFRTYRTASSDAFNAKNSVLALRADEGAAAIKNTMAPGGVRAGQLSKSLEANYRNLRLRKD